MADKTITEEQEQVEQLQKRWMNYDARWCIVTAIAVIVFMEIESSTNSYITTVFTLPLTCLTTRFLRRWSLQRFASRLSNEEREFLVLVAEDKSYTRPNFKMLLKACKIEPQKEYLRPSQQTQETLLRAATHIDTTPQEQLLRPSLTKEE